MRLQKQVNRKIGTVEYAKWVITIPPEDIKLLGWKEGQTLKTQINHEGLLIVKSEVMTYEEFKNKILKLLSNNHRGITWDEMKKSLELNQTVPNNKWVKQLENDIKLQRRKDGKRIYWFIPHQKDTVIFTIGYEGKNIAELVDILKKHDVQQLVDVRQLAFSRKNGFSKSALSKELRQNNIVYKHFSLLGSPKSIRYTLWKEWDYKKFFRDYAIFLSGSDVQEQLTDLEGLAQVRTTAIMCFEKDVNKCHRSLIRDKLIERGFKVVDL